MKQDRNWVRDELERIHGPVKEWGGPPKGRFSFEGAVTIGILGAIMWFLFLIALTLWR